MVEEWKPDDKFLDFLLRTSEENGEDIDEPIIGFPDGTTEGGQGYSRREIVDVMRTSKEKFWRNVYDILRQCYAEDYKEN